MSAPVSSSYLSAARHGRAAEEGAGHAPSHEDTGRRRTDGDRGRGYGRMGLHRHADPGDRPASRDCFMARRHLARQGAPRPRHLDAPSDGRVLRGLDGRTAAAAGTAARVGRRQSRRRAARPALRGQRPCHQGRSRPALPAPGRCGPTDPGLRPARSRSSRRGVRRPDEDSACVGGGAGIRHRRVHLRPYEGPRRRAGGDGALAAGRDGRPYRRGRLGRLYDAGGAGSRRGDRPASPTRAPTG